MAEINISLSIENFEQSIINFKEVLPKAIEYALKQVAKALLKDSRLYVPVLTGKLRDAGRVESVPTINNAITVVRVVYGNQFIKYARRQHEEVMNHPSLGFRGAAKFLEKPLLQNYGFYQQLFIFELQFALQQLNNATPKLG